MKLVVFTPADFIEDEVSVVNTLFEKGMDSLHIKKPKSTVTELRNYLLQIRPHYLPLIALHDHQEHLVAEFGIRRIHYSEAQRAKISKMELELLSKKGFVLSTSVHAVPDAEKASELYDRVFLGPVFDSISKKGYHGKTFPILHKKGNAEIIAIGGVRNSNLRNIYDLGYDGAALLGWLWEQPQDTVKRFGSIQEKWVVSGHTF